MTKQKQEKKEITQKVILKEKSTILLSELKEFFDYRYDADLEFFEALSKLCLYKKGTDWLTGEETAEILLIYKKTSDDTEFLEEGFWTNQQIAEWFGVKPKVFTNKKQKYLNKLKKHAGFVAVSRGVYIFYVSEAVYQKNYNRDVMVENLEEFWSPSKIDTCSRVGLEIKGAFDLDCKDSTAVKYACDARTKIYGKPLPHKDLIDLANPKKQCAYVWTVVDEKGQEREISAAENKLRRALTKEVYGEIDISDIEILTREGDLKKEEVWDFIQHYDNMSEYKSVFEAFKDKTGLSLHKRTYLHGLK